MADYSLVIDSKFDPFSYQELLHPVMTATQAHQQLEDAYGALGTEAATIGQMANATTDPIAAKTYKQYAADLEAKAGELAKWGLSPSSRQGMINLKTRYAKDINPIKVAYERRKELADEQRKMLAQNPTMLYERMANTISLDDLIKNPTLDYGHQYSGALITQQVANAAANLAKEARDSVEGKGKLYKMLLPFQYEYVRKNGFSHDAVMKAILNSPDADKTLTGLVNSAMETSGVNIWGDAATKARALDYARQGLYSAIGQSTSQIISDDYGKSVALENLRHKNAVDEANPDRESLEGKHLSFNPMLLTATKERDAWNKEFDTYRKKGYIKPNKDGSFSITKEGVKQLNQTAYTAREPNDIGLKGEISTPGLAALSYGMRASSTGHNVTRYKLTNKKFFNFINSLTGNKLITNNEQTLYKGNSGKTAEEKKKFYYTAINNAIRKGYNTHKEGSYDEYQSTEYNYNLSNRQSNAWTTAIGNSLVDATNKRVSVVEFTGKDGFSRKEYVDWDELIKAGYKVSNVRPSMVKDKDGNYVTTVIMSSDKTSGEADGDRTPIRVLLPVSINKRIQDKYGAAIANAYSAQLGMNRASDKIEHAGYQRSLREAFDTLGSLVGNTVPVMDTDEEKQSVLGY